MKSILLTALTCALFFVSTSFAAEESTPAVAPIEAGEEDGIKIDWVEGPAQAPLGDQAQVAVPEGYIFTSGDGTRALLESMGNLTSGSELGFLTQTNNSWFVIFRFSDTGYVKDDDKDKLDPDALLEAIREGNEEGNKYRQQMGAPPMKIIGWEYPPRYNEQTHNLEWAIRGESEGEPVINYNTRILGRDGVMEAKLVIEPDLLTETVPVYQGILKNFSYKEGRKYAEYRSGDKLAKYGLAALITGGAAAVAVKTGLLGGLILFFKKGFKLIIVGVIAVGMFFKKLALGKSRDRLNS